MCRESCAQAFLVELGAVTSPWIGLELWPVPVCAGHALLWWPRLVMLPVRFLLYVKDS